MTEDNDTTTKQDKNKKVPNPTGKGGFGDRPEDINRGGRPPKEDTLRYWLVKFLKEKQKGHDKIRMQELAEKIALEAFKGDKKLMKEVFDRVDGKAPQSLYLDAKIESEKTLDESQLNEILTRIAKGDEKGSD